MIILIIMITIIQQITIKNQFLLRVTKINIFWAFVWVVHPEKYFSFLFPFSNETTTEKKKEMQKKVLSEFSKVEKLFNFTF